jgi:hypothetical protein
MVPELRVRQHKVDSHRIKHLQLQSTLQFLLEVKDVGVATFLIPVLTKALPISDAGA